MKFSRITIASFATLEFFFGFLASSKVHYAAAESATEEEIPPIPDGSSDKKKKGGIRGRKRSLDTKDFTSSGADNEDQYFVKFNTHIQFMAADVYLQSDPHQIMSLPDDDVEVMTFESEEELQYWEQREDVDYVEPDHKVYPLAETTPYGINLVKALSVSDASVSNRKVCIIDSGYDINHPDLQSSRSIVTGNSQVQSSWTEDGSSHGTHVAGTIAAIGGNNQGVKGVNRNGKLKLHIVKVFDNDGEWTRTSGLIRAIENCAAAGANVVNMSLGGSNFSRTENNVMTRIFNQGVLLVAAAGNDGNSSKSYPASYQSVMSVAAVDSRNRKASFSQFNDQVDIAAPGVGVLSTVPGRRYANFDGTSMSSPHVAGVAALVWSHFPNKTARQIRQALESTAQDLGSSGRDNIYGHGLIRADLAYNSLKGTGGGGGGGGSGFSRKFMIINPKSGRALDVKRAVCYDTTNIQLWNKHGNGAQIFHYHYASKAIVNVKCNKAIDIDGGNCKNGANLQLYRRNGKGNQQFQLTSDGRIESIACTGKSIDVYKSLNDNGTNLSIWSKHGGDNQKWQIAYIDTSNDANGVNDGNVMEKFNFYPTMDSHGNDVKWSNGGNINAFASECNADSNCKGFNSNGWLKHTVRPQAEWLQWTNDETKGFYVKK